MSRKCRPVLVEMPYLIKKRIVGFLQPFERLPLNQLTACFKDVVASIPVEYQTCDIHINGDSVNWKIVVGKDEQSTVYKIGKTLEFKFNGTLYMVDPSCFLKRAALDIAAFLAHRRASFKSFKISHEYTYRSIGTGEETCKPQVLANVKTFLTALKEHLVQFNHKLKIKSLYFTNALGEEEMMCFLPFIDSANTSYSLTLKAATKNRMHKVIETDVWKNAKRLILSNVTCFRIQSVAHIPEISLINCKFHPSNFVKLIQELLNQPNFLELNIKPLNITRETLGIHLKKVYKDAYTSDNPVIHYIRVGNSNKSLRIRYADYHSQATITFGYQPQN